MIRVRRNWRTQRNGKLRRKGVCANFFLRYQKLNYHFSAQVALDRRDEMDVEGWKVGDPYVHHTLSSVASLTSS